MIGINLVKPSFTSEISHYGFHQRSITVKKIGERKNSSDGFSMFRLDERFIILQIKMCLLKPLFTMIRDLSSLGYIPWGDFEVKTCKLEVFVLESQSAQMCKWRETLDFFYPLTEIKTAYFMEIKKHWGVSIDFFYGHRFISLMLSAFVISFWRHSDLKQALEEAHCLQCMKNALLDWNWPLHCLDSLDNVVLDKM